jgi:hypothetical protein
MHGRLLPAEWLVIRARLARVIQARDEQRRDPSAAKVLASGLYP